MSVEKNVLVADLLDIIVDHLDIPKSYYEKAVARHKSLGEWLCRPESKVAAFHPHVSPQGSFRHGTVNRPLINTEEYDLDNVTTVAMAKTAITQEQLKALYGSEIKGYAKANGMLAPVEEKDRCWRLVYADEVAFHLDTLPCLPEEPAVILALTSRGVSPELAALAIAITDRQHPQYDQITAALLSSNPRGFAKWFEKRARPLAEMRLRQLVERRLYASVDDVPPYEWKTPLQRSIQILKRHRDVMFQKNPGVGPISMIITNLAAYAYAGGSRRVVGADQHRGTNATVREPDETTGAKPGRPGGRLCRQMGDGSCARRQLLVVAYTGESRHREVAGCSCRQPSGFGGSKHFPGRADAGGDRAIQAGRSCSDTGDRTNSPSAAYCNGDGAAALG